LRWQSAAPRRALRVLRKSSTGALIGGIVTGLLTGSTVLMLGVFFVLTMLLARVRSDSVVPIFITAYVLAVAIGAWGIVLARKGSGFLTGLLIGASIGMLGGTALCNVTIVAMSNGSMH
jgi:hypothetical protein